MTSGRLSNCYRDEINDANDNNVANNRTNNNKTITSKSFKYKTKLKGTTTTVIISLHKKNIFPFPKCSERWSLRKNRTGIRSFLY